MLTTINDLANVRMQFSSPRFSKEEDIALVYTAICNAKPMLLESPKLTVDASLDLQSNFCLSVDIKKDIPFQQLLDGIDEIIHSNSAEHKFDIHLLHGSTDNGWFRPKLLIHDSEQRQTKFFLAHKKDAQLNINASDVQKLLKNTHVRLICRLDGYYINISKKEARPLWYVEQCLILDNQINNPVANNYHFIDDDIAPYHLAS